MEVPYKMLKFLINFVDPSLTTRLTESQDARTKELGAVRSDFRTWWQIADGPEKQINNEDEK
uniref:Uncharacterized protein n=1 Tax=Nelumbo nucifera TaxID=4432 RepID=A0A822ZZE6_NELNU|nr:TPA_asm: hypothetical protein HUJ06_018672 [Nelumbo nucifera]